MLTNPEKILFVLSAAGSLFIAYFVARRIIRTIGRGKGKPDLDLARHRIIETLVKVLTLEPTFIVRRTASFFHGLVAWGFMFFLIINLGDILEAFIDDFRFAGTDMTGNLYRLLSDVMSVLVLIGMTVLIIRRFLIKPSDLNTRSNIFYLPNVRKGIRRDSAIVSVFILIHVGSRLAGQSFEVALKGYDRWQPFASMMSILWMDLPPDVIILGEHLAFWISMGAILVFIPYFLISKHIHLIVAPINFLLKPDRRSIGELSTINFDDESIESYGASRVEDLGWEQIMDSYACIMCNRCQDACPAYFTGKVLSPAALEINKRYFLNNEGKKIALGFESSKTLTEIAIQEEAVWACTTCGACVQVCPVNNEPMRDILDVRRSLVLMENNFPYQIQTAFKGMERYANPWSIPPTERLKWAEGLNIITIRENPNPDVLWWVGCAPATDTRAQQTARSFAKILQQAGINFAVMGEEESCTGDSARRAGNEYLFYELAISNVENLNRIAPKKIVTTCPHCLHTLKNEYPSFGGDYDVVHHSQFIEELVSGENIKLVSSADASHTYHDPCYLSRHNQVIEAPRSVLHSSGINVIEMPRNKTNSFCCGAGGAQMWKEEEAGTQRINENRFNEAEDTNAEVLTVSCPFCLMMLTDAGKQKESTMIVQDIAEIVASRLNSTPGM